MSSLKSGIQKNVTIFSNNQVFRGVFLVHAFISCWAPLFMICWNLFLDLSACPCFSLPLPLSLLSLSPATLSALNSSYAQPLPAPSENPSVLWNSPPTRTTYCCLDPLFSQFKSVDFRGVASPLAAFSKSQNCCICPGCSRIKCSWGTRGSCCLLSKTKHPLHLQLCINNISKLNSSFFQGKEHPCNCPALKLFCLCKVGKRHFAKPFPNDAGNCWWSLGKASARGCFCALPNPQPLPREAYSMHTVQHVLKRLSLLPSNFQECARGCYHKHKAWRMCI